jgi:4-diphosphocytidyl-2-C-methyl-D-erythritol kinase
VTAAFEGALRALAPAKVNLGLSVGPLREDGRHELATVMQSVSLADELVLSAGASPGAAADEVICPGVGGPNLASAALAAFREAFGWAAPPVTLRIEKRVPVAAGLAGGSADAAAALRLAAAASGLGDERGLLDLAARLGADVPAQVRPGRWLAGGAGERLVALPAPAAALAVLVLPVAAALATADVYAEADRLGLARDASSVAAAARELEAALAGGAALPPAGLLVNDLQRAAISLCPPIDGVLAVARESGADAALVSGSGPTVIGLFAGGDAVARVQAAAAELSGRAEGAIAAAPVGTGFGTPVVAEVRHNLR